jgi:hypothetical protein
MSLDQLCLESDAQLPLSYKLSKTPNVSKEIGENKKQREMRNALDKLINSLFKLCNT